MKPAEGSTVIGKSIVIRGELSGGNEDLFVDGEIDGSITLPDGLLTVGSNARIRANISARDVVLFGAVDGNITARDRVDLRQTAVLKGDIVAARLSIEENAQMQGRADLTVGSTGAGAATPKGTA